MAPFEEATAIAGVDDQISDDDHAQADAAEDRDGSAAEGNGDPHP
ncbi:hypothetical protein OH799_28590 [Nocardia sp. NBC_00881]|nr:hypothetical protein OH799_28590 [Nocardia sp. NBC_00881]